MKKIMTFQGALCTLFFVLLTNCSWAQLVLTNAFSATSFPSGTATYSGTITINGTFTVNTANFSFINCSNIIMGQGASILVKNQNILTLDHCHLYSGGNYLWGTPFNNWDGGGIRMEGDAINGSTLIMNYSIIEDANVAVNMQAYSNTLADNMSNYTFQITNTIFNRNLHGIDKYNTSLVGDVTNFFGLLSTDNGNIHNSFVKGCLFTSRSAPNSSAPVADVKGQPSGSRPIYGIRLGAVKTIDIGDNNFPPNKFEYLNTAINCFHSRINIANTAFDNIRNYTGGAATGQNGNDMLGAAIVDYFALPTAYFPNTPANVRNPSINIQGSIYLPQDNYSSSDSKPNLIFTNSDYGLFGNETAVDKGSDLTINYAMFYNVGQPLLITGNAYGNCSITNSHFEAADHCVHLVDNTYAHQSITNNDFIINPPIQNSGFGLSFSPSHGVWIEDVPYTTGNRAAYIPNNNIANNFFYEGVEQVLLSNAPGQINYNNFNFQSPLPAAVAGTLPRHNVNLQNTQAIVKDNIVTNSAGQYPANPSAANAYQGVYEQQIAYSATNSPASVFTCNNNEAGSYRVFEFLGNNAGTLANSRISGINVNGIVLANYLGMGGIIGQQGSPTGYSHGNYFNTAPGATAFTQPGGFQSLTISSDGSYSPFYYSAAGGEAAAPYPPGFTGVGIPTSVLGTAPLTGRIDCSIVPTGNNSNSAYRLVHPMIGDEFYNTAGGDRYAPYQKYLGQAFIYAMLRQNDTMMADAADVQAFMATNASTAIGMEYMVDSLLSSLNDSNILASGNQQAVLQAALTANSMIPPDNIFAQLQQKVNAIYLQKMIIPAIVDSTTDMSTNGYTDDEKTSLKSIAIMCPSDGGPAVFMARSLVHSWDLTVVFVDDSTCTGFTEDDNTVYDSIDAFSRKVVNSISSGKYYVAPNPTTNTATLYIKGGADNDGIVEIMDIIGNKVGAYKITTGTTELTIDFAPKANGLYFIHSNLDGFTSMKVLKTN